VTFLATNKTIFVEVFFIHIVSFNQMIFHVQEEIICYFQVSLTRMDSFL